MSNEWPNNFQTDDAADSHAAAIAGAAALGHIKSSASIAVNSSTGAATLAVATAVTGNPAFVGQIAIAGGKVYIAIATTAPTDWKEMEFVD